ncbi:peptidoglycan DD-metalloendopeptidase family protein [Candidatus Peregrinibacteria bacterium]|nr:MAG: peptidoglycan DD-metalloendopeptidase family protein [Candidatus Peregrinibacteria bacterium]
MEEALESIANLEKILENLEEQIEDTQRQILNVKTQEEAKNMELQDLQNKVKNLEIQREEEKQIVKELMMLLYMKRDVYYNKEGVNPVKILASPDSVSQTLQEITYLNVVAGETKKHIGNLTALTQELGDHWEAIRQKQSELSESEVKLMEELAALEVEKMHQSEILDETQAEKSILEAMLGSADQREGDLESEIRIYQNNIDLLEKKLADSNALLSEDQKAVIAQIQADMAAEFSVTDASNILDLDWPTPPAGGLTAFFHDGGYQATFGVDHYALDIRSKQGSSIFAPAEGVVQNVVYDPESTRYAYITVAHRMGVVTLYGHISAPAVAIGDYVTRGQLLGYSGGNPGSMGAGARTTGPHLHFEVWQDGVRVDPLKYLPLEELDLSKIPADYMNQVQSALESQIKTLIRN